MHPSKDVNDGIVERDADSDHPAEGWTDSVKYQLVNSRSLFFRHPNQDHRVDGRLAHFVVQERMLRFRGGGLACVSSEGTAIWYSPFQDRPGHHWFAISKPGLSSCGMVPLANCTPKRIEPISNVRRTSGLPSLYHSLFEPASRAKTDSTSAGSILTLASDELYPVVLSGTMTNLGACNSAACPSSFTLNQRLIESVSSMSPSSLRD
jgi:hypothetical protein